MSYKALHKSSNIGVLTLARDVSERGYWQRAWEFHRAVGQNNLNSLTFFNSQAANFFFSARHMIKIVHN